MTLYPRNLTHGKTLGKIRLAALAAVFVAAAFWAFAPPVSAQTPPPAAQDCRINQGVQARIQSVRDTITRDQDGHVEVSFRNPGANECDLDADLRVTVPTNIIISSKDGGSGTAGTVNFLVSNIGPGLERSLSMDFKCLATGEYTINFITSYWPSGDKRSFQPVTLNQRLVCNEASRPPDTPEQGTTTTSPPPPAPGQGTTTTSPPPTQTGGGGGAGGGTGGGTETPWLLIAAAAVGLVFALIVIVALVALGRKSN